MAYRVPFVDPRTHYRRYQTEIDAAITECLANGDLVYRDQLRRFEENLAAFVGVRYAVGVNSGYHALHFALLGAGVGAGDEVITVAHTFVATISAVVGSSRNSTVGWWISDIAASGSNRGRMICVLPTARPQLRSTIMP